MKITTSKRFALVALLAVAGFAGGSGLLATASSAVSAGPERTLLSNTANQDASGFQISGFGTNDNLLVSVGVLSAPSGTSLRFNHTSGVTASTGYNLTSNFTRISFTGTQANANQVINSMRVNTAGTGTVRISVSATVNPSGYFYLPSNGHFYLPVSPLGRSGGASAFDQVKADAANRSFKGQQGYLVTITSGDEQNFLNANVPGNNILIALRANSSRQWFWDAGPEAGTVIRTGDIGGTNVSGRYNNWCSGEPNNWGAGEDFGVTKWSGGNCWNDYGPPASSFPGSVSGYVVEFGNGSGPNSQNWADFYQATVDHSVVTLTVPTVSTSSASSITTTSATLGGSVTFDGGVSVTARGVVVSPTSSPVRGGAGVIDLASGSGTGAFSVSASNLSPGVTYFARAYGVNSEGVGYGSQAQFTMAQLSQSISFAGLEDRVYSTETQSVSATADSGLAVSFSSTTSSVCTVTPEGGLTLQASGTCSIRAAQPGNVTYSPAPIVEQSFDVAKAAQSVTLNDPGSLTYGDQLSDPVGSLSSVGLVTVLTAGPDTVCAVSGEQIVINGAGICAVEAVQSGDDRYLPASAARTTQIAPRTISLSGERVYDGTLTISAGGLGIEGLVGTDGLGLSGAATVATGAVGNDIALDVSGVSLLDAGQGPGLAANYTLDGGMHRITTLPRRVLGRFGVQGRVYDGTTAMSADLITSRSLVVLPDFESSTGVVDGDEVLLVGGTAELDEPSAGSDAVVRLNDAWIYGPQAENYILEDIAATTVDIGARPLTVGGSFGVEGRVYDGSVDASVVDDELVLVDVVEGDGVGLVPVARFDDAAAGDDKVVRLTAESMLDGVSAQNYVLSLQGAPVSVASIARREVTANMVDDLERVYDGTLEFTLDADQVVFDGVVAGESLVLESVDGVVDAAQVGDRILMISSPMVRAGSATDLANYRLPDAIVGQLQITRRPLGLSDLTIAARPYDATTTMLIERAELTDVIDGDAVSIAPGSDAEAASASAGSTTATTRVALEGMDSDNYSVVQSTIEVEILPRAISVEGATVLERAYDTTQQVSISGARLDDVLPGDELVLIGDEHGLLAAPDVGTHRVVTSMSLAGRSAPDYALEQPDLEGTVTPRAVELRFASDRLVVANGDSIGMEVITTPAGVRVDLTYAGNVQAPVAPGTYRVVASITDANHIPIAISTTMTVLAPAQAQQPGSVLLPTPDGGTVVVSSGQIGDLVYLVGDPERPVPRLKPWTDLVDGQSIISTPMESSGVVVLVDGERSDSNRRVEDGQRVLIDGAGFGLAVESRSSGGETVPVGPDGSIRLQQGAVVHLAGSGYAPDSWIELWLFSTPFFLGYAEVGPDGSFDQSFAVPAAVVAGGHTAQINGFDPDGQVRSISLGLMVDPAPVVVPDDTAVEEPGAEVDSPVSPDDIPEDLSPVVPNPVDEPGRPVPGEQSPLTPQTNGTSAADQPRLEILPRIALTPPSNLKTGTASPATVSDSQIAWGLLMAGVLGVLGLVWWRNRSAATTVPAGSPTLQPRGRHRVHHGTRHARPSARPAGPSTLASSNFRQLR